MTTCCPSPLLPCLLSLLPPARFGYAALPGRFCRIMRLRLASLAIWFSLLHRSPVPECVLRDDTDDAVSEEEPFFG